MILPSIDCPFSIEHGNNLEDVICSKFFRLEIVGSQIIEKTFHHPRGVCLAGMNSGGQENDSAIGQRREKLKCGKL